MHEFISLVFDIESGLARERYSDATEVNLYLSWIVLLLSEMRERSYDLFGAYFLDVATHGNLYHTNPTPNVEDFRSVNPAVPGESRLRLMYCQWII